MSANSNAPAPWVSFCMTTRRRPDFLLKTLKAIQRQTVSDFEVIISDNDTAGSGRAVVESLKDPRLRYYCNEADLGMNPSFNRSLAKARGEFVVMITDDDPIYPEMLELLRDLAQKHPGFGCYFGGADVLQLNPDIAKLTLHKVGTNSCLAPLPYGTIRTFTAETFPHAFLGGEIGIYMLWSVGMTRRDIAQSVGLPAYGSPYLGDFVYTLTTCSRAGVVVANQSVGCQTVHDFNFGRTECGQLKTALLGFVNTVTERFSNRADWPSLKPKLEKFAGQWIVLHCAFLRQYFKQFKGDDREFKRVRKEIFRIPFMKGMRLYYYAGAAFISFMRFQSDLRTHGLRRMHQRR
jgi:glycosyltransferase involved in cell wall biosynthesis